MNTPITDAAWDSAWDEGGCYPESIAECSRRLELDRAALMEALEKVNEHMRNRGVHMMDPARATIDDALSTARANFP